MTRSNNPFWLRFTPGFIRKRLEGRTNLHAIMHNTGWLLADKLLRMGMGILVGAWVARYLGPSQFGELAYVVAFVAFFGVISKLGFDGIAVRDMALDKQASPAILGTVLWLRMITGCICWIAAIAGMALFRPGDTQTLILTVFIAGTLVFQAADTVDLWFQSQTQSKRTVIAKTISYLVTSGIKIGLILTEAPLVYFAATTLIDMGLAAIALYGSYRIFPAPFRWYLDMKWVKRLVRESWPYMLSGLAVIIYMRIDQIMLREMIGEYELGIYSAAMPIATVWYFFPMIIAQSVGPSIAKKKEADQAAYEISLVRLFGLMWWIMLPLSIILALFSGVIIDILYGDAYAESGGILAVYVFSCIPASLGVIQGLWMVNEKKSNLAPKRTVIGAFINVILNIILIKKYGVLGAAYSTVLSQSIAMVFSNIIFAPKVFRWQLQSVIFFWGN